MKNKGKKKNKLKIGRSDRLKTRKESRIKRRIRQQSSKKEDTLTRGQKRLRKGAQLALDAGEESSVRFETVEGTPREPAIEVSVSEQKKHYKEKQEQDKRV